MAYNVRPMSVPGSTLKVTARLFRRQEAWGHNDGNFFGNTPALVPARNISDLLAHQSVPNFYTRVDSYSCA